MLHPDIRTLIAPVTDETFLADYWEQKHLFAPGCSTRLDDLRASFGGFEVADLLGWRKGDVVASSNAVGAGQRNVIMPCAEAALERFEAGETLVFNLDTNDDRLKPWYDAFTGFFAPSPNRSVVTAFCSPPGHGTSMHFDRHDVFNVPLSGTKTWRIAPNHGCRDTLHDWQIGNPVGRELGAYWKPRPGCEVSAPTQTFEMSPGSVLYLPRGYFHETLASDEPSIGISFIIDVTSYYELIGNAVRAAMLSKRRMRRSANGLWHGGRGDADHALRASLDDLQSVAASLTPEDIAPPPANAEVHADTRLRKSSLAVRTIERIGDRTMIVARRIDQSDAAQVDATNAVLIDWIDGRASDFTARDAFSEFERDYGRAGLSQLFEVLLETGYLTYA